MSLIRHVTRIPYVLGLWERFPLGSVHARVLYGIFPRPNYAFGVYWGAVQAARLRIPRISVIELGVAGGRGLIALEQVSAAVERAIGVGIDVVGFDTGGGMPVPADYRDLPHIWGPGFYQMDVERLRARLRRAELVLGDVGVTTREWARHGQRAPLGFVAFDLDYYSSTKSAFTLFEGPPETHLPRVNCYFDDITTLPLGCMNEHVGELLAIREFNDAHADRKVAKLEQLRIHRPRWEDWQDRMYAFHDFAHPQYNTMLIPRDSVHRQLPL